MSGAFQYRPKFVDIRVRPPKPERGRARGRRQRAEAGRAGLRPSRLPPRRPPPGRPKSRDLLNEHYWFCQPHAAEYNRNWNFFAGMSEGEVARQIRPSSVTGGRPTWAFKARAAPARPRPRAVDRACLRRSVRPVRRRPAPRRAARRRSASIGKLERNALADLDLDATRRRPADPRPLHRAGQALPPRRQRRRPLGRAQAAAGDQGLSRPCARPSWPDVARRRRGAFRVVHRLATLS